MGQRPCSICGIFVDSLLIGIRCPCCNNKLRLIPRNAKSRKNRFFPSYSQVNTARSMNSKILESDPVINAELVLNK